MTVWPKVSMERDVLQGQYKCRSLVKRLTIKYSSERNESKNKILRKFLLYNFLNPFIKFKIMATVTFNLENSNFFCIGSLDQQNVRSTDR